MNSFCEYYVYMHINVDIGYTPVDIHLCIYLVKIYVENFQKPCTHARAQIFAILATTEAMHYTDMYIA